MAKELEAGSGPARMALSVAPARTAPSAAPARILPTRVALFSVVEPNQLVFLIQYSIIHGYWVLHHSIPKENATHIRLSLGLKVRGWGLRV